jgi:aspartate aminotransferase-like enzyme/GNAT superfamily N-acetyltransferase
MSIGKALKFKIASEEWEFEAIHRLNYKTFVEEIPQHERNEERRLVDKFHTENTYAICLDGDQLVGMVCGRDIRPFSLDGKLADLDSYLPAGRKPLEVRLLSVEKDYRNGQIFSGLVRILAQHFRDRGCDLAIISGTTRQTRLYKHLGFRPFGPLVGNGDAQFQPMSLTLETFLDWSKALSPDSDTVQKMLANYLPGPVDVRDEVKRAFERNPVSHRSDLFMADFRSTKRMLCELTRARHVEILVGSGSLANDAVCGQIKLLEQPGLILSNGEFGERLVDQAKRQGLEFEVHRKNWGEPFDYDELRRSIPAAPRIGWIWGVHCETSTGILNNLAALQSIAAAKGLKLCLDCISSIGTLPIDLSGVYLASCVSGKALAAFPGLSMVFYNHELKPAPGKLPLYLDLGYYAEQSGIPFTHPSNLLYALQTTLRRTSWPEKYKQIFETGRWLRTRLRERGFQLLAPDAHASPAVFTITLPPEVRSRDIGAQLKGEGYLLSHQSGYLLKRNWIQICLMGEWDPETLKALPDILGGLCKKDGEPQN